MAARVRPRAKSVVPAYLRVTVTCPLCQHRIPMDWFSRKLELSRDADPEFWRLWPRKPDGGRGFHWEKLSYDQLHRIEVQVLEGARFEDLWTKTLSTISATMIAWLNRFGVDSAGREIGVQVVPRVKGTAPGGTGPGAG